MSKELDAHTRLLLQDLIWKIKLERGKICLCGNGIEACNGEIASWTTSSCPQSITTHMDWFAQGPKDKSRWMWVDGSRASYTNWNRGEPNNSGGIEDCAHFWPPAHSWKWNDARCSYKMRYVCETNGRLSDRCYSHCESHVTMEEIHSSCHITR